MTPSDRDLPVSFLGVLLQRAGGSATISFEECDVVAGFDVKATRDFDGACYRLTLQKPDETVDQ